MNGNSIFIKAVLAFQLFVTLNIFYHTQLPFPLRVSLYFRIISHNASPGYRAFVFMRHNYSPVVTPVNSSISPGVKAIRSYSARRPQPLQPPHRCLWSAATPVGPGDSWSPPSPGDSPEHGTLHNATTRHPGMAVSGPPQKWFYTPGHKLGTAGYIRLYHHPLKKYVCG